MTEDSKAVPAPARIVLATLNARYIHAALGLRYLLANMARHGSPALRSATVLREYTINRPAQAIVDDLLLALSDPCAATPRAPIVGFGVYIWNVAQTTHVVRLLKAARPDVRVVLGGPEVSYELEDQPIVALADYVITGWGDVSFPKLCHALQYGPRPLMKVIAGEQPPLDQIDLPYGEFSDADLAHRVLYVEASRGCPYKCEFCLSALDKTAWAFDVDTFLVALHQLYGRGARHFKFFDRTFNLKMDACVRILQFFLDRLADEARAASAQATPLFLHFEVIPDYLPERLKACLTQFPPGVLQFEVGIQSFNPEVQQRVSRRQDNAKTEANLRWLLASTHAHLHTDLIFGLPGESWLSFAQGFDRLVGLGPHEIQLGVLKRLRGTALARRSLPGAVPEWGMVYAPDAPYTVVQTDVLTSEEIGTFVRLARYWDLVANSGRFSGTVALLLHGSPVQECNAQPAQIVPKPPESPERPPLEPPASAAPHSAFAAFAAFSEWLWVRSGVTHGLSPEALVDYLFDYLCAQRGMAPTVVRAALLADYVAGGARAQPACLRGFLALRMPVPAPGSAGLAQRQQIHGNHAPQASKIEP